MEQTDPTDRPVLQPLDMSSPPMADRLGLRERKKRRTHAAIEQAALSLFVSRGFDATTIDEIAAAVDVSARTFFRYFPTKEHVVFDNSDQVLGRLRDAIRAAPADAPDALALRDGFIALARAIERHREDNLVRGKLIAENPSLRARAVRIENEWEMALADELAQRSRRKADFATRVLVASVLSVNRATTDEWAARGGRGSLPRLLVRAFDALINEYGRAERHRARDAS
jgi:AcrR family transcriptional regulator